MQVAQGRTQAGWLGKVSCFLSVPTPIQSLQDVLLGVNSYHEKTSVSENSCICICLIKKILFQSLDINVVYHQQWQERSSKMICAINSPQAIKLLFQTLSKHCRVRRKLLQHIPKLTLFLASQLTNTQTGTVHATTDTYIPHKHTQIQIVSAHTPQAYKCVHMHAYMPYTCTHTHMYTHHRLAQYIVYIPCI